MTLFALLLLLFQSTFTGQVVPNSLVGRWKIGKPFYDMTPQPIGINAEQQRKLIGKVLDIRPASISACGKSIQIASVGATRYSADTFLQAYRITPDQIGLAAPLTEYSPHSHELVAICDSPEGFEIVSDGKNAVLEIANDYLHLTRLDIAK